VSTWSNKGPWLVHVYSKYEWKITISFTCEGESVRPCCVLGVKMRNCEVMPTGVETF